MRGNHVKRVFYLLGNIIWNCLEESIFFLVLSRHSSLSEFWLLVQKEKKKEVWFHFKWVVVAELINSRASSTGRRRRRVAEVVVMAGTR